MTSETGTAFYPSEVAVAPPNRCGQYEWRVIQKRRPTICGGQFSGMGRRRFAVGMQTLRRQRTQSSGMFQLGGRFASAYWAWTALGWSGMTLAIDGPCRRLQKGRQVLRGGGPVACVMPLVTEFVTLLADFVTIDRIDGM